MRRAIETAYIAFFIQNKAFTLPIAALESITEFPQNFQNKSFYQYIISNETDNGALILNPRLLLRFKNSEMKITTQSRVLMLKKPQTQAHVGIGIDSISGIYKNVIPESNKRDQNSSHIKICARKIPLFPITNIQMNIKTVK